MLKGASGNTAPLSVLLGSSSAEELTARDRKSASNAATHACSSGWYFRSILSGGLDGVGLDDAVTAYGSAESRRTGRVSLATSDSGTLY